MKKSDINRFPEYFDRYINLVTDDTLSAAFETSEKQLHALDKTVLERLDGKRYAPDKWTVKDIVQHVIDTERIFAYRALRFARNDNTALPGFDENLFANHTNANSRTINDLVDELHVVRHSTKLLFKGFDDDMLRRVGRCWNYETSVITLGFTSLGHQTHHLNVITERYLPLLEK
jgi:hypothetical protein